MAKIWVEAYGCSASFADSEMISGLIVNGGHTLAQDPSESDLNLIVTCSVKDVTATRMIHRIKQSQSRPLVVAGCLPKAERHTVEKFAQNASMMGPNSIGKTVQIIEKTLAGSKMVALEDTDLSKVGIPKIRLNPTVGIVEIANGCMSECTFCKTKIEKGDLNSTSTVLKGSVRTEKVRGIQAAMAKQMSASVYTIPHFTVSDELVMDNLMSLRKLLKPEFEAKNVKLSFMPFFVKAMSLALNEFPVVNSQLNEDATEISYFADHNIGFAVDSKIGLLVPNIKRVQDLSLLEIAVQMQDIIEQARAGRVAGEHLKGGTISISNIGAIGGITATPVINKPEAAIVALGKTQKLPRFDDEGNVSAQNIMAVNWSGDHRIIDGATMVRFNNLWMSYLTQPEKMLMHLK